MQIEKKKNDLGDFQTPIPLASAVCTIMKRSGVVPDILVEPTCGKGNFIVAALECFPAVQHVYCVEAQRKYEQAFWENMSQHVKKIDIELFHDNVFTHEFPLSRFSGKQILVLGNPPWVTNSELSQLASENRPARSNVKKVRGIDAMTGKGNFDIAEAIILKMAKQLQGLEGWIAFLCKNSVIKNVVRDAQVLDHGLSEMRGYEMNTKREFGITAPGSFFMARAGSVTGDDCRMASFYEPGNITKIFGWVAQKFVSDVERYRALSYLDGESPLEWRQGVKNDAVKIMVLQRRPDSTIVNGFDEVVDIEPDLVYPHVKGSSLRELVTGDSGTSTIITQARLGDDTTAIEMKYPRTWAYLNDHGTALDARKSAMYKNKPRFSLFGIGAYAFKPYKVAIASFYKSPRFSLVLPVNGKPTMLDDTCYYISFDEIEDALVILAALNARATISFLGVISFADGKRVYSKDILMRLNIKAMLEQDAFDKDITSVVHQMPFKVSVERVIASKKRMLQAFQDAK